MDFEWDQADAEFRERVEEFVSTHLPTGWTRSAGSVGSTSAGPETQSFARELAEADLLVRNWPKAYGGEDASAWQHQVLAEVMWRHGEPRGPQYMNVNWIGPAIMRFGTEAQKQEHLQPMARGEALWCQGFSEPDAGSDLASLRTRAVRDGDEYIVNGQKIWTSYAGTADHCFLLARTDQEARRHRGISVLLVPMDSPGVEVRTIRALIGDHSFHELHFTDVRVPTSCRLGAENEGWAIVREALAFERVGLPRYVRAALVLDAVEEWARANGLDERPDVAARILEARAACEAARLLVYRVVDEKAKASPPSHTAYVARVATVDAERAVAALADDVMGLAGLDPASWAHAQFRNGLAVGISSGTYEIQLNLVAQHVLELPKV